jgi:hypothetical protein
MKILRTDLIDEILTHTGNYTYSNFNDNFDNSIYRKRELKQLSNEDLVEIFREFTSEPTLELEVE